MPDGFPLILGSQNNTATLETRLVRSGGVLLSAFHVENDSGGGILGRGQTASENPPHRMVPFGVWGDSANGTGVYGSSTGVQGVYGRSTSGNGVQGVSRDGAGVDGTSTNRNGVQGTSTNRKGVEGTSTNWHGVGGRTLNSQSAGVIGLNVSSEATESPLHPGVSGASYLGHGVVGQTFATGASAAAGVFGSADRGAWAGVFDGQVIIYGDLTVFGDANVSGQVIADPLWGLFSFRIDHPLEPANKYLNHSSVASPDTKNIYDGLAILDANGEAVVELPEYFEALNADFRYQLTAIGAAGPNLHVAEKITDNRFKIGGGDPGMEVCWQVTGIRKDRVAEANRTSVEEDKPHEEQGYYLHPQLYGEPEEQAITWARDGGEQRQRVETSRSMLEDHRQQKEEYRRRMEEKRHQVEERSRQMEGW